jgi:hypothetical protein
VTLVTNAIYCTEYLDKKMNTGGVIFSGANPAVRYIFVSKEGKQGYHYHQG